ncbi:unnamed protein product, partial [Staurois parvus]
AISGALCPSDIADHRSQSRRCRLNHVISCVQSQLITCKQGNASYRHFSPLELSAGDMYTDHQGTDDQCALMISVAPSVPPVCVHQCLVSGLISASCQYHITATYQCLPVHITATYQCPSELPFSVTHQCRLSVPISDACQCLSVPPTYASSSV